MLPETPVLHKPTGLSMTRCPHCQAPLQPYPLLPLFPKECYYCWTCHTPVLVAKEGQ